MRRIRVVYGNHWNFGIHVSDIVRLVKCAFEDLNYRVDIEKEMSEEDINIVIENFSDEYVDKIKQCHERGGRFFVIATEFLTDGTFNYFGGDDKDDSHYKNKCYWFERYSNFKKVLEFSDALFHLSEHQIDKYQSDAVDLPVLYFPHCYVSGFASLKMRDLPERDVDVLFTGTLTDYRKSILSEIKDAGFHVEVLPMLTASFHRDDLISRSKICLNLPQDEEWEYQSNSRLHYHLINSSPIMTQSTKFDCDLQKYVLSFDKNDCLNSIVDVLGNKDYLEVFEKGFEGFKTFDVSIGQFENRVYDALKRAGCDI